MKYFMLILACGLLGGIATLIFAFQFDHVPTTNNGINGVFAGAVPIGVICGFMVGILVVNRMDKRKRG